MGSILIHAGTPKSGSTSVQAWMARQATTLRREHGIWLVSDRATDTDGPLRFAPVEAPALASSQAFLLRYWRCRSEHDVEAQAALVDELTAALGETASRHGSVLVTSEHFSRLISLGDEPFLGGLATLADRHDVCVAHYVRPQHSALESRWRAWGFRSPSKPSVWVREEARQLHYHETVEHLRRAAPSVSIAMRPFRRDLLDGGDVVVDFARRILEIPATDFDTGRDENPGLPLDAAILLRAAPAELITSPGATRPGGMESGRRQLELATLLRSWEIAESPAARRSREILTSFAHDEFESENRTLIRDFAWPTQHFVPTPSDPIPSPEQALDELDVCWEADTDGAAAAYLFAALRALRPA